MATYNAHHVGRMKELHGAELASFSRRLSAFLLDMVFLAALFIPLASMIAPILETYGIIHGDTKITFALNLNWYSIVWTVVYFGLAMYWGKGKTPGKWLLGIRVVSLVHARISLWHSIERALGYGASVLEGGFGFFQYFIHPNKCTVHDRIAETIVIRDARKNSGPKG
jgi:uncharacterized RDD family membrane protein YckC